MIYYTYIHIIFILYYICPPDFTPIHTQAVPSNTDRFQRWAQHILEGIEAEEKGIEHHELHRPHQRQLAAFLGSLVDFEWT